MKSTVWLEVSLLEHWGPKPHGIPRVSQNLFLQSRSRDDVRYFYYHRSRRTFIATQAVDYFVSLAHGDVRYSDDLLPAGEELSTMLGASDRVLFSEVGWDHAHYLGCVQQIRSQFPDAVFQYVLCDLIPIKLPHFFEADFGGRARDFMRALPTFCDRYVCISESTARDVRSILSAQAEARVFRLGSDVSDDSDSENRIAEGKPYVLSVGTIEIRKNHILLYFVWRQLALALGEKCPKLILVGRPGWIAGDVYTLLQTDPVLEGLVEIKHNVENEELVGLIRGCLFTIFPSFYEGWGLPASESLFYGKVCVTSNTSSLPEINPFPELMFDPYNHQQAFEVVRGLVESPAKVKQYEDSIPKAFQRQTWEQSFDELHDIVVR